MLFDEFPNTCKNILEFYLMNNEEILATSKINKEISKLKRKVLENPSDGGKNILRNRIKEISSYKELILDYILIGYECRKN